MQGYYRARKEEQAAPTFTPSQELEAIVKTQERYGLPSTVNCQKQLQHRYQWNVEAEAEEIFVVILLSRVMEKVVIFYKRLRVCAWLSGLGAKEKGHSASRCFSELMVACHVSTCIHFHVGAESMSRQCECIVAWL